MTPTPEGLPAPVVLTRAAFAEREGRSLPKAPVRIVHVGLGAFARAHPAWYTAEADQANEWGIAAFTGRSASVAEKLAPQDGLFSVIERSAQADALTVVGSIVEAWDGTRLDRLVPLLAAPATSIVTLTITEPGYRLEPDGTPNLEDATVAADAEWLRTVLSGAGTEPLLLKPDSGGPQTALGRLLLGLDVRRRTGAGPIAVVPCDNMPHNGSYVRTGLLGLAARTSPATAEWITANVSFVSTSVDRITPRTTAADIATVTRLTGWLDAAPVVTEPFRDWVLSGDFPAGRPAWERAGARFVDEIEPFERRKLWLLNGAHSLLACSGLLRGHETVASAIADPACRGEVHALWEEAMRHLPAAGLDLESYRAALLSRFENSRIEHRLAQIAAESITKLRVRVVPVAVAELEAGRTAKGCATALGAWIALMRTEREITDAHAADVTDAVNGSSGEIERRLLALLSPQLADDPSFVASVHAAVGSFD